MEKQRMDEMEVAIELLEQVEQGHINGMEILDGKLSCWTADSPIPVGVWQPMSYSLRDAVPHGTEGRHVVVMRKV
jgi:hypothetical protein